MINDSFGNRTFALAEPDNTFLQQPVSRLNGAICALTNKLVSHDARAWVLRSILLFASYCPL